MFVKRGERGNRLQICTQYTVHTHTVRNSAELVWTAVSQADNCRGFKICQDDVCIPYYDTTHLQYLHIFAMKYCMYTSLNLNNYDIYILLNFSVSRESKHERKG